MFRCFNCSVAAAGIYLIEWPKLDFGLRSQYQLSVKCQDTADNIVFGTFTVNIIENQKPIFLNLDSKYIARVLL